MSQLLTVDPCKSSKGVYNFWVGDGASRLNGGMELAFSFLARLDASSSGPFKTFTTLFILIDETWAIGNSMIQKEPDYMYHKLYKRSFYEILAQHPRVALCRGSTELSTVVCDLTAQHQQYIQDDNETDGQLQVVLVMDMHLSMPATMFPFLHAFMEGTPEGRTKYQYISGITDIQASHMCGFDQVEGKSVMFLNDVYGINSLGESLRMNQSGFGDQGRQMLLFIWHPSSASPSDNFSLHRPPMVWPSVSNALVRFFVGKEEDAAFFDFDGTLDNVPDIQKAMSAKTPLILVNMLPEHERHTVPLDIRVSSKV
ncbi:expressed unknown protein [Seminavis robusta]|uniref:Uncharacterized protein n=1 Tax=Seminavis robusta TaxID=568900 RepID=A0A9N8HE88_9STRA|nr:expressed unknown protein [Seminavis robusta]|eukprot:Sro461_g147820.1 n/a (313) ;mRNA; r:50834-51896